MATVADSLKPGLTALSDFSNNLSRALEGIDENVGFLRHSLDDALKKLQLLQDSQNQHDRRLKVVESETNGQRESVENAMKLAASVEKSMGNQLNDATKNLHKEMLNQRTLTKLDLGSLRSKLEDSMGEAMSIITDNPKYARKSLPVYNPNFTTEESIKFFAERINQIDEAMERQGTLNEKLSSAMSHEDALQQQLINQLTNEIDNLQNTLSQSQNVNASLLQTIDDLKSVTKRQEEQLGEVYQALTWKDKLKDLRTEMRSRPSSSSQYLADKKPDANLQNSTRSSKKSSSQTIKRQYETSNEGKDQPATYEDDDEVDEPLNEEDDEDDEKVLENTTTHNETSSNSKVNEVVKQRSKSKAKHPKPSEKKTKQNQKRKGQLRQISEQEDDGDESEDEEDDHDLSDEELEEDEGANLEAEEEFNAQREVDEEAAVERKRAKAAAAATKKLNKQIEKSRLQKEKELAREERRKEADERRRQQQLLRQQQLEAQRQLRAEQQADDEPLEEELDEDVEGQLDDYQELQDEIIPADNLEDTVIPTKSNIANRQQSENPNKRNVAPKSKPEIRTKPNKSVVAETDENEDLHDPLEEKEDLLEKKSLTTAEKAVHKSKTPKIKEQVNNETEQDEPEVTSKSLSSGRKSAENRKNSNDNETVTTTTVTSGASSRNSSKPASANKSTPHTTTTHAVSKPPAVNKRQASTKWLPFNTTDETVLSEKDKALLASMESSDFLNPQQPRIISPEDKKRTDEKRNRKKRYESDEEYADGVDDDDEDSDEYDRRRRRRRQRHRKRRDDDDSDEEELRDKEQKHRHRKSSTGTVDNIDAADGRANNPVQSIQSADSEFAETLDKPVKVYTQLFDDNDTLFTPSLDSTGRYKDGDSESEAHLEWLQNLEDAQDKQGHSLKHLRQECDERLGQLETQLNTFKRIVFAIEDLKINYDSLKKKVDGVHINENNLEEKLQQAMLNRITRLKDMWTKIHFELIFALDNAQEHDTGNATNTKQPGHHPRGHVPNGLQDMMNSELHSFFQKARELSHILENGLDFFHLQDTLEMTLEKLFPSLEKIHSCSDALIKMDDEARKSASLDYSFDDLLCSDLTPSLRSLITEAQKDTVPVLDEYIAKIYLYRKINKLQEKLEKKVDTSVMMDMENETRRLLSTKVDHAEFVMVTSKLASSAELQRLQVLVSDLTGGNGSLGGASGGGRISDEEFYRRSLVDHPDFQSVLERFQSLVNKQFDLEQNQEKLISKEEIQEALKAIVNEVKNIRKNCVTNNIFKEGLKGKADVQEVEKLVKTITDLLGDFNLTTADLATSAAAVHAKCLICDKPVSSQRSRQSIVSNKLNNAISSANVVGGVAGTSSSLYSRSLPQLGYEKSMDAPPSRGGDKRSTSPNGTKSGRVKVATDMAIVRSSIEPLPELSDSQANSPRLAIDLSIAPTSGNPILTNNQATAALAQQQIKQRIRSSAGGGMGPGYKKDTR